MLILSFFLQKQRPHLLWFEEKGSHARFTNIGIKITMSEETFKNMTFQDQNSICCESYTKKEWSGSAILVHFLELKLSRSIFLTCLVKFPLCFLIQLYCKYGNSIPGEFLFWIIMLYILSAFAVSVYLIISVIYIIVLLQYSLSDHF